jgi:trehalose 6-phosphate synthase
MPRQPVLVVSNREPYLHRRAEDGSIKVERTTGGVAVALDALMRDRGGTWIAHGAGNADRDVVDDHDRVAVPARDPAYQIRRIWLSEEEEARYYGGFSNEGLWPLCHIAHVKPIFRSEDWAAYQTVNGRFAAAIAEELTSPSQPVFIHDYHLALVAGYLRARRPSTRTALFWHIPWPHPDRLRMCPWRREIVRGLLANDLLAFQVERDRRNFVAAAREELGAEIDGRLLRLGNHAVRVTVAPIGVDFDRITDLAGDPAIGDEMARLRKEFRLPEHVQIGVGVDRLDYTKGIPERLDAVDQLLTRHPEMIDRFVFIQVGVPSRSKLKSYSATEHEIDKRVAAINERHGQGRSEGPIRYHKGAFKLRRLVALYRLADVCVVSSLHDGMNLVAKEFVAARIDDGGMLVLSELTGAAQELQDAIIINPYDIDGFAGAIWKALQMPASERVARMRRLRRVVAGHDVFVWASEILTNLERLGTDRADFGAPLIRGVQRADRGQYGRTRGRVPLA